MIEKKIVVVFLAFLCFFYKNNSFAHNNDTLMIDRSYIGLQYSKAFGIKPYLFKVDDDGTKQNGFMKHFDGYGLNANYIRDMNSDFFTEFKFGYNKKSNDISDNILHFEEEYKVYDALISFGKFIDVGCNVYPYGSFSVGMALVKNQLNLYDLSSGSMSLKLASNDDSMEIVPEIAYELGIAFAINAGILTFSYDQKILADIERKNVQMIGADRKVATNLDFKTQFNTYNLAIGFKFPL